MRARKKAGYRLDGKRIYYVKGKTKSTRKTYGTRAGARRALKKRGRR